MNPKTWEWSLPTQLAAHLYNATVGKRVVTVPGSEDEDQQRVGSGALPVDELDEFLNSNGGG